MSIYYDNGRGTTAGRAGEIYTQKFIYRADVLLSADKLGLTNIVDFNNFGEKLLYGRVNYNFVPVEIRYPSQFLRKIPTDSLFDPKANLEVAAFILPMLQQLRQTFTNKATARQIDTSHKYLSDIKVHKAYINPNSLYDQYLNVLKKQLRKRLLENTRTGGTSFTDISSFMTMLADAFENMTLPFPFTKSAFIKSRFCPINCSGLVIEIADLSSTNDQEKIKEFINSKNWNIFVRAANASGFMIDASVPWRLVADVGPSAVEALLSRFYGTPNARVLMGKQYIATHERYFINFVKILYNFYSDLSFVYTKNNNTCADNTGQRGVQYVQPKKYTWEEFSQAINFQDVFRLYCHLRFSEEESQFTDAEKHRIISDCIALTEMREGSKALRVFERIINKTFDYTGSASYNLKRMNLEKENMRELPSANEIRKESELGNVSRHPKGIFGARTDPEINFGNEPIPPVETRPFGRTE